MQSCGPPGTEFETNGVEGLESEQVKSGILHYDQRWQNQSISHPPHKNHKRARGQACALCHGWAASHIESN